LDAKGWLRRKSSVFGSHGVVRIVEIYRNFLAEADYGLLAGYRANQSKADRLSAGRDIQKRVAESRKSAGALQRR
jgi:hypothetical protein